MAKSKITQAKIVEHKFPNRTKAVDQEGNQISLKGGIVDQKVQILLTRNRKNNKKGKILDTLERAPIEVESPCPHSPICGGCSYQTLTYEDESKLKENLLKDLFKEDGLYQGDFHYEASQKVNGYRNKMEYTFGDEEKDGPLALGLHRKAKFHELVNTDHCLIVPQDMNRIRMAVREYFDKEKVPFYHRKTHKGVLRHLVIRTARETGQILVNLVTTSEPLDLRGFLETLQGLELDGKIQSIYHTISDDLADAIKPEKVRLLAGSPQIEEELLGLRFRIGPFSFFQPNPWTAERIYEKARALAGREKGVIFDLYSGTGTIGQILAKEAKEVIGIEIIEEAVEQANQTAKENGIHNAKFLAGDVLKVIDEIETKPDLMVMDPPRDGIHPKAIGKLLNFQPPRILYISCNPVTLKRDLEIMKERGYKIDHLEGIDQFPRTLHCESIALLSRPNTQGHLEIE